MCPKCAAFVIVLLLGAVVWIDRAISAVKANGLVWLAVGVAAAQSFLVSRYAIPIFLLLILFALWSRNAKLDDLKEAISELAAKVDELEEKARSSPSVDDDL